MHTKFQMNVSPWIYLVDDDQDDRESFQIALSVAFPAHQLRTYTNGEDLLAQFGEPFCLKPALIFLDLQMPVMDGHQLLTAIKTRKELASIPVIMFSGTDNPVEIKLGYQLGVQSWFKKPVTIHELTDKLTTMQKYWFETVENPHAIN